MGLCELSLTRVAVFDASESEQTKSQFKEASCDQKVAVIWIDEFRSERAPVLGRDVELVRPRR